MIINTIIMSFTFVLLAVGSNRSEQEINLRIRKDTRKDSIFSFLPMHNGTFVETWNETTGVKKLIGFSWTENNKLVENINTIIGENTLRVRV